jgi:hypothetical protein
MIEELCNFNIAGKYEIAYIVDENLQCYNILWWL